MFGFYCPQKNYDEPWRKIARKELKKHFDEVFKWENCIDFVEAKGQRGGDVLCFRYYKNGEIYER